ncbi:Kiwa anti-phage protein KwaB-like domain-containing protein [Marivirga arenosa]|uniref:DUF4868 domain-containing protein n=1 Tax=Marivirga arenosa TaxID=3059076 RepID=A0AA51ZXX2_9BACT|nr:Kiwa anti-phage protein KwaB-like domain-containing protein [Marivirga sp. BKB1-2]WNB18752.1 DUF4868 domain-containing protein [Marivirga sp. BKB1-2]
MIDQFLDKFEDINDENLHLYFITRVLKPNLKKRAKVLDKYDFEIYQVDIDKEIASHLYDVSIKQLEYVAKKNLEITEYEAITDSTQQIFTYDGTNKAMSFLDVVQNKLKNKSKIAKIKNLTEIVKSQELWAYTVGFFDDNHDWIYSFRKILKGKVAIDEEANSSKKLFGTFRTKFNTVSNKLEVLKGETINLDERIDCIYFEDIFYIFQKTQFEQITGLTEEFKEHAEKIADELIKTEMFDGLDILKKQIKETPAIHRKLVRLKKINNYQNLNEKSLNKMIKIAKRYGGQLKKNNGKIIIENEKDVDLTIKVLVDFYKTGEFSGKPYGTFSGKELTTEK